MITYCKHCGELALQLSIRPRAIVGSINSFFRQTRINRIKSRLGKGDWLLAFFPATCRHNVEYSFFLEENAIRMESHNFNMVPSHQLTIRRFASSKQLVEWVNDSKTTIGYDIGKEATEWIRKRDKDNDWTLP